ncbi:MAG: phosphate/phosphite/phosphonate ABC transporter substrate-binding protein [Rhizobiaceae bacterium]|nr:phosphate/phosphite/phosphonate ABC transporter substrate-binding protein [Rhizobiaceae bacterium]
MGRLFQTAVKYFLVIFIMAGSTMVAQTSETLVFGTYAFEKPTTTVQKMRPILDALEIRLQERFGKPVKIRLQIAQSYHRAIQDLVQGRVDFGRYGQAAYVFAKEENRDLDILAVEGDQKKKTFQSVIIVHNDSRIFSLDELTGKSFAFGSIYSTTGRYFPQDFLTSRGITVRTLSRYSYLQRHDRVGWAVSDGSYDAGVVSKWVYEDLKKQGAKVRPIATFATVTKPWVARSGLSVEMKSAISDALISLRGVQVLKLIKKDCFLPGDDRDYDSVRMAIANNRLFFVK